MNIVRAKTEDPKNEKRMDILQKKLADGKRHFGSAGASLTHQVSNPMYKDCGISATLAAIGLEGEHKTSRLLKHWLENKPNVVAIDSIHIKGAGKEELNEETGTMDGGDTDHILVIGDIVILVDAKAWKGKRKYTISQDGEVLRGGAPFPGGKLGIVGAAYLWRNYLSAHKVMVSSIVCITSEKVWVQKDVNWWKQPYRLVPIEQMEEFLDSVWEKLPEKSKTFIDVNLISSIVAMAIKPYDVQRELLGDIAGLLTNSYKPV